MNVSHNIMRLMTAHGFIGKVTSVYTAVYGIDMHMLKYNIKCNKISTSKYGIPHIT